MIVLDVTKDDCRNVYEMMEIYFFQNIRDDPDMDNIDYIKGLLHFMDELEKVFR